MEPITVTTTTTFLRVTSVVPSPSPPSATTASAIDNLARIPNGFWVLMSILVSFAFALGTYAFRLKWKAKAKANEAIPLQNLNPAPAVEETTAANVAATIPQQAANELSVQGDTSSPNDADPALLAANGSPVGPSTPERLATPQEPATPGSAPSPTTPSSLGRWIDKQKDRFTTVHAGTGITRNIFHAIDKAASSGS